MQHPRGTEWPKKVRNIWWHTVQTDTMKTETSNFVLDPSLHRNIIITDIIRSHSLVIRMLMTSTDNTRRSELVKPAYHYYTQGSELVKPAYRYNTQGSELVKTAY